MSWNDERIERLKTLWTEGLSASQIAEELGGVTRNAVIGKVHRLGLSGRVKPQVAPVVSHISVSKPKDKRPRPSTQSRPKVQKGRTAPSPQTDTLATPIDAVAEIEPPVLEKVTILEITDTTCKWPVGDPHKPDFFFCGRKSDVGIPYCAFHARIAYQPSMGKRRVQDRKANTGSSERYNFS